jgi:hypothetical protein
MKSAPFIKSSLFLKNGLRIRVYITIYNNQTMPLSLSKMSSNIVSRREVAQEAARTETTVSSGGNKVQIRLEAAEDELLDPKTFYIGEELIASQTGGTAMNFNDWAASTWIRNVDIKTKSGALVGNAITDYNAYMRQFFELQTTKEQVDSHLDILEGARHSANSALTRKSFFHKMFVSIFGLEDSYYPIGKVGGLVIELTFESPENVLSAYDGTSPKYTVSELRAHFDLVRMDAKTEQMIVKEMSSSEGMKVDYQSFVSHQQNITTGTSQNKKLGIVSGKILGTSVFQVLDSARSAGTTDYWPSFGLNNLSSIRFKLGSAYFTDKEILLSATNTAEYLVSFIKALGATPLQYPGNQDDRLSSYPVLSQKMDLSKFEDHDSAVVDEANNEVTVELKYSSAPAVGTLYSFVETQHRQVLKMKGNGKAAVSNKY